MKRVVGLPGERVLLAGNRLFIDGREMNAPFLYRTQTAVTVPVEIVLKSDEYFVLGDNLDHSVEDSRVLGPISQHRLRGRVACVIR